MTRALDRYRRDLDIRPLELARNLPAGLYTDPDVARIEADRIFSREWQLLAHAARLDRPGAFLATHVGSRPVVVTRDAQEQLHVLENVCRHRGGPVAEGTGCAHELVCRYHGWRYGLDGALHEATDFGRPEGFDPAHVRLPKLPSFQWCGWLLASSDRSAEPPSDQWAAVRKRLSPHHPLETYAFDHREVYDVACNWKVYVDNYLEGYHVPSLHPGLSKRLELDRYTTEVTDHYALQWSPLESGDAYYFHLFPNLMLNCLPGSLQTNVVLPLGPERCRVVFEYHYAEAITPQGRRAEQAAAHQTQLEDMAMCETVQRNMESGGYVPGRLSPRWEEAVWAFQNRIRTALAPDSSG